MNSVLSICVPTYGRPELLRQTVESLIEQARVHDVEIIISDNSEDDLAERVARDLKNTYDGLRYSRNEKNLGIDRNFLKVASMARSTHIWFFGDDDRPEDGAVTRILDEIRLHPGVGFYLINSKPYSPDLRHVLSDNLTGIATSAIYTDCNEALRSVSWYSTFIGAFVVRREAWNSVDPTPFLDTVFVHVGIMFTAMATQGFALKFVATPLIRYRTGAATWSSKFLEIQFELWRMTINLLPKLYDEESRRIAVESVVERFVTPGALVGTRTAGHLDIESFKARIWPYLVWARKTRFATWKLAAWTILLLLTPVIFLRAVRVLYRRIKYR